MTTRLLAIACLALVAAGALAQTDTPPGKAPPLSEHVKADIARHRAMAQAHDAAARCLASGQSEDNCQMALRHACKGLAIGKYCGLRHEH